MRNRMLMIGLSVLSMTGTAMAGAMLDVKTGHWEMTTTRKMSGLPQMPAMPAEMLEQMPAEQKAMMEQAMKAASGEEVTDTTQQCLTEKDLQEAAFLSEQEAGCTNEIVSQSSNHVDVKMACENEGQKMQGQMRFEAADGETVSGTIDMKGSGDGGDITIAMRVKGKWLGADCGGVE